MISLTVPCIAANPKPIGYEDSRLQPLVAQTLHQRGVVLWGVPQVLLGTLSKGGDLQPLQCGYWRDSMQRL